jgi:DNA polymerase-3 subunit delta'
MGFETIKGQPLATSLLRKTVATGRVGGGYLFVGPEGVGKSKAARLFAMALNCESRENVPCSVCPACRKILAGEHPDVFSLGLQEGKSRILIEQIRELQEHLAYAPYEGKRRVVIIDPADNLSPEAANAFLLTLEAPPAHTVLILVTSSLYALLPTIRSRCQIVRFSTLSKDALLEIAKGIGLAVDSGSPYLERCQGSMSRLMNFINEASDKKSIEMWQFLTGLFAQPGQVDLIETPKWAKQRKSVCVFLGKALWLLRDLLVAGEAGAASYVIDGERTRRVREKTQGIPPEKIQALIVKVFLLLDDLRWNAAPDLVYEYFRCEVENLYG